MRTGWVTAVCVAVCLAGGGRHACAQATDEPDPCADAVGPSSEGGCWQQQADAADALMNETVDALVAKLTPKGAAELKRAQKLWLEFRQAHLAVLYAVGNPDGTRRMDGLTCAAIARRQLALARTRELKRLLRPMEADEACRL